MIKHKFHLTFLATELGQSVKFEKLSERFKDIELNSISGRKYELIIGVDENQSTEDSYGEADSKANDLIDRLSLLDQRVTTLEYIGSSDGLNLSANLKGTSTLTAALTAHIADPLKFYKLKENNKTLLNQNNSGPKRVYRHTLEIKDDISKYLIYYGLLQILISQKQKALDRQIIKMLNGVQIVNGKYGNETIITRVRNMIAHPESLDMKEISLLVKVNIEPLRKMVVTALLNAKQITNNNLPKSKRTWWQKLFGK